MILYTVDAFIFVGTNFRGLNKITHSWGSKFMAIVFSFIIHTEKSYFLGTRIRGSDPPRKLIPMKIKPSTQYMYSGHRLNKVSSHCKVAHEGHLDFENQQNK